MTVKIRRVKKTSIVMSISLFALLGCTTSSPMSEVPQLPNAVSPVPGVVAAGRLKADDVPRLHEAGIRHVIDLSVDAETPDFDEARVLQAAGIAYSNLPIRGADDLTLENVIAFEQLMGQADRPVLVHCASANRVGAIAALRAAWVDGKSEEDAVRIGKAWGLKSLEPQVRERMRSNAPSDPPYR